MEMERFYYVVTCRDAFAGLVRRSQISAADPEPASCVVVAITQGGFGQDVVDEERQVKERYLEHLFESTGIDLPRSSESFDEYFALQPAEFIDLDDDA
jgi:hypothetical protein